MRFAKVTVQLILALGKALLECAFGCLWLGEWIAAGKEWNQ